MERWLQERRSYAEALRQRVQRSGSPTEAAALDRFLRQTAIMEATAEQLGRTLPPVFGCAHGLRLRRPEAEIYLEHLVVGPTGIFLIETLEGDDPAWMTDLARNIAYFRQILGQQASFFTCLVVSRSAAIVELPEGVHLVDSVERALHLVQDNRLGMPMPPEMARQVWHSVQAASIAEPMRFGRERYWDRVGRPEQLLLGMLLVMSIVVAAVDGENDVVLSFIVAVIVLALPSLAILGLLLLIPGRAWRRAGVYTLWALSALWALALVAASRDGFGS